MKADGINACVASMLFVIFSMFFSAFCLICSLSVWSPVIWAAHKLGNSHHVKGLMYNYQCQVIIRMRIIATLELTDCVCSGSQADGQWAAAKRAGSLGFTLWHDNLEQSRI